MVRKRGGETAVEMAPKFTVGVDIPDEIAKHKAIYDMILVERLSAPEMTMSGLFIPIVEGKDERHMGKVLSVPEEYGLESEQGRVIPVSSIAPCKVGDVVYIKVKN